MPEKSDIAVEKKKGHSTPQSELAMVMWVAFFIVLTLLLGFWVSMVLFTVVFLYVFGRENWKTITIFTASIWGVIFIVFDVGMNAELYGGLLEYVLEYLFG